MVTDNTILISNIEFFMSERGMLRIGEFEKNIDVSPGYFSRLKKNPEIFPSIDILSRIADCFGITLDVLVMVHMEKMGTNIQIVNSLIERLKLETLNRKRVWSLDNSIQPYRSVLLNRENCYFQVHTNGKGVKTEDDEQYIILQPVVLTTPTENPSIVSNSFLLGFRELTSNKVENICYSDQLPIFVQRSFFELDSIIRSTQADIYIKPDTVLKMQKIIEK